MQLSEGKNFHGYFSGLVTTKFSVFSLGFVRETLDLTDLSHFTALLVVSNTLLQLFFWGFSYQPTTRS